MRFGSFLAVVAHLHSLLIAPVAGYGVRGYAERAMFFLVYQMEEIWGERNPADGSGWKIAPECKGTRRGIFARNRCNLADFVDYIWAPMDGETEANRPPKDKITWGRSMTGAKDSNTIISLLADAKIEGTPLLDLQGAQKTSGYQGKLAVATRLWPGQGITTYEQAVAAFGQRAAQLSTEMDKAIKDGVLGDPDKEPKKNAGESDSDFKTRKKKWDSNVKSIKAFRALYDEAKGAALRIQDMRMKDMWDHIKRDVDWKSKLGVDPVWDRHTEGQARSVGEWYTINAEKTVDAMVEKTGKSREEARALYDKVWDEVATTSTSYQNHRAALNAAQKSMKDMGMTDKLTVENLSCPL